MLTFRARAQSDGDEYEVPTMDGYERPNPLQHAVKDGHLDVLIWAHAHEVFSNGEPLGGWNVVLTDVSFRPLAHRPPGRWPSAWSRQTTRSSGRVRVGWTPGGNDLPVGATVANAQISVRRLRVPLERECTKLGDVWPRPRQRYAKEKTTRRTPASEPGAASSTGWQGQRDSQVRVEPERAFAAAGATWRLMLRPADRNGGQVVAAGVRERGGDAPPSS